jgi:hypothetical protein
VQSHYRIRVEGHLDAGWSEWFGGLTIRNSPGGVAQVIRPLPHQAALHGVLAKVRDLGLPLLSVQTVVPRTRPARPA